PMEIVSTHVDLRPTSVLLATAAGRNPDVLGAFRHIAEREPRRFLVFSTTVQTPLALCAARFGFVDVIEVDLPSGKDGFLATNSLLASAVLLTRLYSEATDLRISLPGVFRELLSPPATPKALDDWHKRCLPLW